MFHRKMWYMVNSQTCVNNSMDRVDAPLETDMAPFHRDDLATDGVSVTVARPGSVERRPGVHRQIFGGTPWFRVFGSWSLFYKKTSWFRTDVETLEHA